MRSFRWMTVVFALVAYAPHARSEQPVVRDPAAAEVLFREGRKLVAANDFAAACPKFAESQRLDPAVGTLLNWAACEEHVGKLASAWQRWKEALDALPPGDDRIEL